MGFDENFLRFGPELPPFATTPLGLNVLPSRRTGSILYLAGHGPSWGSDFRYVGKLGREVTLDQGIAAARLTALNLLQTVRSALGTLDLIEQIINVSGMVNSSPGFIGHPRVINGCSDCLVEIFGSSGKHARASVGMAELPFNISVEIAMIVETK